MTSGGSETIPLIPSKSPCEKRCWLLLQTSDLQPQEQELGFSVQLISKWVYCLCSACWSHICKMYLKGEVFFIGEICPNKINPAVFFSSLLCQAQEPMVITRSLQQLKQLVVLFLKVQFSFWEESIQLITYLRKNLYVKQLLIPLEGSPWEGSATFPRTDNRLIAFVLNYPFWTKTAPLRRLISFPQAAKELLDKWSPPTLSKILEKKTKQDFFYSWHNDCKFSCCFYVKSFLLGSGHIIFGFSARR